MAVKLRVSKNVVGEMTLPVKVDRKLTANAIFVLSDEDYANNAVQIALRKKFLLLEEEAEVEAVKVEVSKSKKKINVPLKKKQAEVIEDQKDPSLIIDVDSLNTPKPEKKTKMASWNVESQKLVGKDESAKMVREQLNSSEEMAVQTGEVDFTEKKELDSNEESKVVVPAVGKKKTKIGKKGSKKAAKSLSPVGEKKEEIKASEIDDSEIDYSAGQANNVSFVDQEQQRERIERHPVLRKSIED